MKTDLRGCIAAYYQKEVADIPVPPPPRGLRATVALSRSGASARGGRAGAFRRRLVSEAIRIVLTAAVLSGGVLLTPQYRAGPVARGIERLASDANLRDSVSARLSDAALMLGKSLVKE